MFVKSIKRNLSEKKPCYAKRQKELLQRLRGIELDENAIPRHGYKVLKDGKEVGEVTTGYHLISADKSCAVALVDASIQMGDRLEIQIRKKTFPGTVVKKKFYEKHYKKK